MRTIRTDEEKKQLLAEAEASDLSLDQFCKQRNVHSSQFYRWREQFGMKSKTKRYGSEERARMIRQWEESGLSGPQFAARIGVSRSILYSQRHTYRLELAKAAQARRNGQGDLPEPPGSGRLDLPEAKSSGGLRCPRCGCEIVHELASLVMKLKALENL